MVESIATPPAANVGTGDLIFRVCGSSRHGQIVRLQSAKCTIGSSPQCTLRLRARGVHPVHCLVLRGEGGSLVRRWSPDTRLNGRAFTDAELTPGDRLSIGRIDLEVVELGRFEQQRPRAIQPPATPLKTELDDRQAELERPRVELDARQAELDARRAELDTRQTELDGQQQRWQEEQARAQEQFNEQSESLDARAAELNAGEAELDRRREEFENRCRQWENEHAAVEPKPSGPTAEGEAAEEVQAKDLSEDAPVDIESVLHRMGSIGLLRDEEEDSRQHQQQQPAGPEPEGEPEPELEPPAGAPACQPLASAEPTDDKEEESIDDYMTRLMQRVGATVGGAQAVETQPQPSQPLRYSEPQSPPEPPSKQPATPPLRKPVDVSRRAVAPENPAGLSAMRELANLSATNAIDRHGRQKLIRATRAKAATVVAGVGVGAVLMWFWWAMGAGLFVLGAAVVSFLVSAFWGIQYVIAIGRLILNATGNLGRRTDGPESEDEAATSEEEAVSDGERRESG